MEGKYIGKEISNLKKNHVYLFELTKPKGYYVYNMHIIFDVTAKEEMDKYMQYASQVSIKNNFKLNEEINVDKD